MKAISFAKVRKFPHFSAGVGQLLRRIRKFLVVSEIMSIFAERKLEKLSLNCSRGYISQTKNNNYENKTTIYLIDAVLPPAFGIVGRSLH